MHKARLEAFSDAVLAIVITLMALELRPPRGEELLLLHLAAPAFLSYALSFVFLGIYWNNHHHLFQAAREVNGAILWANLHLLFWLSLVPFTTAWMGETRFAPGPVALYGIVLLFAAAAYFILARALVAQHGTGSALAKALGADRKGKVSVVLYAAAVPLAFKSPAAAWALYLAVAALWLVPDRRIERILRGA